LVPWTERSLQSKVKNVNVNSTPEKIDRNRKWNRLNDFNIPILFSTLSFLDTFPLLLSDFSSDAARGVFPLVSGRANTRKTVSRERRTSVSNAGAAYTFNSNPNVLIVDGKGREAK
jgi:hypothetical protein